jgi:3-oxoadipate enol-lactonase
MSGGTTLAAQARPTVLLLTGVGLTAAVALRAVAPLEARFRVLSAPLGAVGDDRTAEERTVTTSDEPGVMTAQNAVALLDAAGVDQAHVVGLSFGGAIAQELAIRYPDRVRSLVLGSSTAGGKLYVAPERPIRQFLRRLADLPAEEGLWAAVPYLYVEATYRRHAPLIGQDIARRLGWPLNPRSYRAQHSIARAHDTSTRVAAINVPTLVMHGENDRILPPDNGRLLADAIPEAQFVALQTGAHAFPTDVPHAGRELVRFLLAHSQARPAAVQRRAATRNARAARA